ncbi:ABC transporter ATP-binding protein [Pannonibacter tanglangensis]|uniref:ATP-binding cassette domain-containing protein n=1 Tax=Pannonibacter tanglangensis TaxID=2750084 RepID=A0ABW9ZJY9_9HYPH|nr:ABC transporter ATP-binding protein [Pannonibacter sp. XCT-34]NBN65195.1 ATP-binding cassette domain-containing protein [Pannonibacter sp. XCT-34]
MSITLDQVVKVFGTQRVLDDVSLTIAEGEFFVVLGPSGCGKSTLLRLISGLEPLDGGRILINGREVAASGLHLAPEQRGVGVVFQSYALWPHMTVAGNVAFPLETAGRSRSEVARRTEECLATVELTRFADRKPADLSGGQRQRVALARCLAQGASTILMDEPLANLDPHLRGAMEEELSAFHKASGATTLFITHDQREAMALADRIAILWDGRLLQADAPELIYRRPRNRHVAGFIGQGSIVTVRVTAAEAGTAHVRLGNAGQDVACAADTQPGTAALLLRPEDIEACGDEGAQLCGRVERSVYRGGFHEADVAVEGLDAPLMVRLAGRPAVGERIGLRLRSGWLLPA